ncbi:MULTISPECIES: DUF2735 domain-containing protein [Rhodopseudomonas]|uniref:DUF2735 domain-containing protein n=1 Tax=Rhodopseudomonas palustris TaxID=1076 RepID=A0A0D7EHA3_RHOPL|nr:MULTISPECIES: DUF2735 domain-containing protein [Rhodopseudomonas]KIZ39880.1 hypothetical protein OO17_19245 [Rhodopseudomonas palustris]MDF3813553.1 DUF2735 domain-containing protein [Rhodopseudomonas sp. BAL398]WOK15400.1 DUF2735 domain-containing protein [Rhodopseudomonas sp. BAL398]
MVNTNLNQGSARIYQFPVGGRAGLSSQFGATTPSATPLPNIVSGSSWYHEAAVAEDRTSKPQ